MNRQERERILASLTDNELEQLRDRIDGANASEDPTREFLRAVIAGQDRDWIAELAERLSPTTPEPGNHVSREGRNSGNRGRVTERQRLTDFVRAITDPTHEPQIAYEPEL